MLCKIHKIYLFLMGIVLFGGFSNGQNIESQQHLSMKSTIIEKNDLRILSWNIKMMPEPYGWFYNLFCDVDDCRILYIKIFD